MGGGVLKMRVAPYAMDGEGNLQGIGVSGLGGKGRGNTPLCRGGGGGLVGGTRLGKLLYMENKICMVEELQGYGTLEEVAGR